ncbi:MAG: DUF2330 domain-containing protein [Betaproteobacteria bacterium]|jgi:hypothetical protein|nr:DUF2330 domain-containing protein [Betaproteobacteria bacterium]
MNALIRPGFARILAAAAFTLSAPGAHAFCGFYVGKADANLFNDASQVVMVRDGDRTTITMRNQYEGDLKEFAMVVPVPEVLAEESIKVVDDVLFQRIDAYSAPRLAEYYDANPCHALRERKSMLGRLPQSLAMDAAQLKVEEDRGVTVEATYTIGEYDVVILSAKESSGLEIWLRENGYRIPEGAAQALAPYIRQDLKFFVAKVNLAEQAKTGSTYLRPMQFSFHTEKFMLPIRLGMLNARGPQDLVLWVLTRTGRVEATNYRTIRLPANMDIPTYVKGDFRTFYKALFDTQAKREDYRVLFTEYVWNMSWCDPCAANPLTPAELRGLGVDWVTAGGRRAARAQPVMLTRLHVRYTAETFPEDLVFQETKDRANYQARYVLRHPAKVKPDACPAAGPYLDGVAARQEREAKVLATLTNWDVDEIRDRMGITQRQRPWWEEWWVGMAP